MQTQYFIWLMILFLIALATGITGFESIAAVFISGFALSIIFLVDKMQKKVDRLENPENYTSRFPLYFFLAVGLFSSLLEYHFLVIISLSAWLFFLFRWLNHLEFLLKKIYSKLDYQEENKLIEQSQSIKVENKIYFNSSLFEQIKIWLFEGNLVLKTAVVILVIGIILLLRFIAAHLSLSLSEKLIAVAVASLAVVVFGYALKEKNQSFALALQGLGLASLFLTLSFSYNHFVIENFLMAFSLFIVLMILTIGLSFKQNRIELAIMATLVAYIAPFTLIKNDFSSFDLLCYYLAINFSIAIMTSFKAWKYLNQIGLFITILIGGIYTLIHGLGEQSKFSFTILILANTILFVWLGLRYSQLLTKQKIKDFNFEPILDLALVFTAPLVGFAFLYFLYFNEQLIQAIFSFSFAVFFLICSKLITKKIDLISKSYFSLFLIFTSFILPILLPNQWSVLGWGIEGALIFLYAIYKNSNTNLFLAIGLLIISSLSNIYYIFELDNFPNVVYWILSVLYLMIILLAHFIPNYMQKINQGVVLFFCYLILFSTIQIIMLCNEYFYGVESYILNLFSLVLLYTFLNEILIAKKVSWTWTIPKTLGLLPIAIFSIFLLIERTELNQLIWVSPTERILVLLTGLLLARLWFKPLAHINQEKEWVTFAVLLSLAFSSLALFPNMPYLTMVFLPLVLLAYSYKNLSDSSKNTFLYTKSTLFLLLIWLFTSQLFAQEIFNFYLLPILNPFDLMSLMVLIVFITLLNIQLKNGLSQNIAILLLVPNLLWLFSYVLLRALNMYLATPLNDIDLWHDATVQLSLTILWVILAFIMMQFSRRKQSNLLWLLGAIILVLVSFKLVLLDLAQQDTWMRVLSFLGAGLVMLIIAYIAPKPEN